MATKRSLLVVVLCLVFSIVVPAQEATQAAPELTPAQKSALIKEFARSATMDGVTFNYVLLNNKTIDILFPGDAKYAMRARANAATMFFVQGIPSKDLAQFNPKFVVEQDGKAFEGENVNIRNLQAGAISKGTKIEGLIQLSQKINVTQPFKIKNADSATEFKLSEEAVKLLQN
ncbi:MAG: hypothetical protein QUT30_09265 [Acidobacteriota bacterium]|nr:hypothetical protein [Acidobacteriota bacterium]